MQAAQSDNLRDSVAALFHKARETGKPAKAPVAGLILKASPHAGRLEFQVWNPTGRTPTARQVEALARAAGMIWHVCREIKTEGGVPGLYVQDRADWSALCIHSWEDAEEVDNAKEKSSFQRCRVCGSVAGTLEKRRSPKGPRHLYNGKEVAAETLASLRSSGPLPFELPPEGREAVRAAVNAHNASLMGAAAAAPLAVPEKEAAAAPGPAPEEDAAAAPEEDAEAAAAAALRAEARAVPSGPHRPGRPYPQKAAERIAGKLYWQELEAGHTAFFTLSRDVIPGTSGAGKAYSEHFATGYIQPPETEAAPGSALGSRKLVFFERLTASALERQFKTYRASVKRDS